MILREHERIDDLMRRGYRIIQNETKFCFGIDPALLAWFAEVKSREKVMDLCSGSGVVPILMDARNACGDYTGLEIQEDMAEMAQRSAELNSASDHIRFVAGDVKEASSLFPKGSFDVVTVNPPYMKHNVGLKNPDESIAIARHEILLELSDVLREAAKLLRPAGRFYMIHRPGRLPEILQLMQEYRLQPERMIMVHPNNEREATMVLISGIRGGRNALIVESPVMVHETPGVYTDKVREIYYNDGRH